MQVRMGNVNAVEHRMNHETGKGEPHVIGDGLKRTTVVGVPEGKPVAMAFLDITDLRRGVWALHSADPAPEWVESDSKVMQTLLAEHYGCPEGQPKDWKDGDKAPAKKAKE